MKANMMDEEVKQMLATSIQIIDLGADRGAWKGEELEGIGRLRTVIMNKLNEPPVDDGTALQNDLFESTEK